MKVDIVAQHGTAQKALIFFREYPIDTPQSEFLLARFLGGTQVSIAFAYLSNFLEGKLNEDENILANEAVTIYLGEKISVLCDKFGEVAESKILTLDLLSILKMVNQSN